MRVLLTHERFPPDVAGGGEVFVASLAEQLAARGLSVRVLTTGKPATPHGQALPVTRLPMHRYRFNLAVREIARHARDADLVHTFNYHAALPSLVAARWLRKPVVCGVLGLFASTWTAMRGPLVGRAFVAWEKHLVRRRFDRFLFLSDYSRDVAVSLGMPPERGIVLPLSLDLDEYAPGPKENVVLFVGRLDARKGIHDVLAVARALPSVSFRVIGWGPEEEAIRRAAPRNVDVVRMPDAVTLRHEFARARIFLLPSRAEGSPLALLQAMASGCAVVCTLPFTFDGVTAKAGDRAALVEGVQRLWLRPEEATRMGERNRELARRHDWTSHSDSLMALYDQLIAPRGLETRAAAQEELAEHTGHPRPYISRRQERCP